MDGRTYNHLPNWWKFDEQQMTISDNDGHCWSAKWEICSACEGKGRVVNPSIDSNGITPKEFNEDPDFAEAYFTGVYDEDCRTCKGAGKILVPACAEGEAMLDDVMYQIECDEVEHQAEIEMGC